MEQAEAPPDAAHRSAHAPAGAGLPPGAWAAVTPERLAAELASATWTLVEYWSPANPFGRLMAPVRRQLPLTHGQRLRLLCCVVADDAQLRACAPYRVRALPELALYQGTRCARRWGGAVDIHILRRDIEVLLDGAGA